VSISVFAVDAASAKTLRVRRAIFLLRPQCWV